MVEEVRQHIQEMLDGGAIHPSQCPWCNAVVLMCKKEKRWVTPVLYRLLQIE